MATPTKLVSTSQPFQDAKGTVVALGFLTLQLSQPAEIASGGGQVDTQTLVFPLDANGKISPTAIWFADELNPAGTTYRAILYGPNGATQLADFGNWSIVGASADLSLMVPTTTGASYPNAVLMAPSGNQTIVQPAGTNFNVNRFENIRFADQFASSSTTSGIQEAINDLPSTGGTVWLPFGAAACTTGITITKPIRLMGHGTGGPTDPGTDNVYIAGSTIINNTTGTDLLTISLPGGNSLSGVTLRDFAIQGNKNVGGVTAGDCLVLAGGNSATQLIHTLIDNVLIYNAWGNGISIKDNVFMTNIRGCFIIRNGAHGIALSNTTNAGPSQTRISQTTSWLNATRISGDGLNLNGTHVADVAISQSTLANNTNGVNVVVGTTNGQVHALAVNFEANTNAGFLIKDGYGHSVCDSMFPADAIQLFGVNVDPPGGASFALTQIYLENNNFGSSVTKDIQFSANLHKGIVFPQANNNYTYLDSSSVAIRMETDSNGALRFDALGGLVPNTPGNNSLGASTSAWNELWLFGKLRQYNGVQTVSGGIPAEVATVDLTGQTAAIGTTTLYAVPANGAGVYRLSWTAKVTTPATTGSATSTLGPLTISYTDPDGVVQTFVPPFAVNGGTPSISGQTTNNTGTFEIGLSLVVNCKASTNITYAMAYASNTAAQMAYNLRIKLEAQ